MKKRLLIVGIALGLVIAGMLYYSEIFVPRMVAKMMARDPNAATPVAVAQAKSAPLARSLTAIGTIAAVHQVTVSPEIAGRVVQISFEAGSTVKAGATLVQLNDAPERADLANFEAQSHLAQSELHRTQQLLGRQFAPQQQADQQQATLDQASAGIARTQAMIAEKNIRAPFDGQLGIRQVEVGQYLDAGGAIVTITDLDRLYVNFSLPEQDRSRISVGMPVEIKVDAYAGRSFVGKLTTIEPQISAETRNIKLQATLDNPEHLLLPGMFADTAVTLPAQPDVVMVPETAVDFSLYGESVFVVRTETADSGKHVMRAYRTVVKTGGRQNGQIALLDGVKAGDLVVESGQIKLSNASIVEPRASDQLTIPAKPSVY